jgi:hypothetical protein
LTSEFGTLPAILQSRRFSHSGGIIIFHTCPKDFVENRNISNILEEAPPLRNKLEFAGLKARGILSPIGRHNNSPAWSRNAAERWVK